MLSMHIALLAFAATFSVSACTTGAHPGSAGQRAEFWAFTGPWETESWSSVRQNGGSFDAIVTGWIALDSLTGRPLLPSAYADTVRPTTGSPRRMAIVTSWVGERFHPASVRSLGADRARLADAAGTIARYARSMAYSGLVIDFEALEARDLDLQLRVVRAIADSARKFGVATIAVAVPATDLTAYPSRELLAIADFLIPMLYDQHWAGGEPGPIAAPDWVRESLALRVAEVGPERIVGGLPTYGYRWQAGKPGESIGYVEARRIAAAEGIPLRRDERTHTLRARRPGSWDMWVSDADLLQRLVREGEALGVRRFALWRLGQEDPAIFQTIVR